MTCGLIRLDQSGSFGRNCSMQLTSSTKHQHGTYIAAIGYFCALPFVLALVYINSRVSLYATGNRWRFALDHSGAVLSAFVIFIGPWIILGTFIAALITLRLMPRLRNRIGLWILGFFEAWVWVCVAKWFEKQ